MSKEKLLICLRDKSASTAIEFAMVAPLFLAMVFAIIGHSFIALQQSHLDYAVYTAASRVKTGDLNTSSLSAFKQEYICNETLALIDCDDLEVGLASSTQVWAPYFWGFSSLLGRFCAGGPDSTAVVAARYEIKGIFKTLYFGFRDTSENEKQFITSRFVVLREPTVNGNSKFYC